MRRRAVDLAVLLAGMALSVFLLRGCPGPDRPLSTEQMERIERGMTEAQVFAVLGEPSEPLDLEELSQALGVPGGGWRWRSPGRKFEVYFIDGKVAGTVAVGY